MKSFIYFAFALTLALAASVPLTGSDKDEMLSGLNAIRASVDNDVTNGQPKPVSSLNPLSWSEKLANLASARAFSPNSRTRASACSLRPDAVHRFLYGEVVANFLNSNPASGVATVVEALQSWALEARNYNWDVFQADQAKNYLHIVNQNATEVGCALMTSSDCPDLKGEFYRCLVNPRGAWAGLPPYKPKCTPDRFYQCDGSKCGPVTDGCGTWDCGRCPTKPDAAVSRKRAPCVKMNTCYLVNDLGWSWYKMTDGTTSNTNCVQTCRAQNKGFTIAATTGGTYCLCSVKLKDNVLPVTQSFCNQTCKGDVNQICGDSPKKLKYSTVNEFNSACTPSTPAPTTPAPTQAPTTKAPVPTNTSVPTTNTPTPTTNSPAPTTNTPVPTRATTSAPTPTTAAPTQSTQRFEAESGQLGGGKVYVATDSAASGGSYVNGFVNDADTLTWTLPNYVAGKYRLQLVRRTCCGEKYFNLNVNGVQTYTRMPDTGTSAFTTQDLGEFTFVSGTNTVRILGSWGYYHLDALLVTGSAAPPQQQEQQWQWKDVNNGRYVSPMKNQGSCGSCWAHSGVSLLETYHAMISNTPAQVFSAQEMVDCNTGYGSKGCAGGWPGTVFAFVRDNGGLALESNYPYLARDGTCAAKPRVDVRVGVTGAREVPCQPGDEACLLEAVKKGPVGAAIYAGARFQNYVSGVYDDSDRKAQPANTQPNHAVVIEGYGTDTSGLNYWLVRNTWGTSWGNNGYAKWIRGTNDRQGITWFLHKPTMSGNYNPVPEPAPTSQVVTPTSATTAAPASTTVRPTTQAPSATSAAPSNGERRDTYYTLNGKVYDPCGEQFIMRGVNHPTIWWDRAGDALPEIAKTGANIVRLFWMDDISITEADAVVTRAASLGMVAMLELHDSTGTWDVSPLVDWWTRAESVAFIRKHQRHFMLNIANEASTDDSTFSSGYRSYIQRIRNAGITVPLVIDAGGWGRDWEQLYDNGLALLNADPLRNVILSAHLYDSGTEWNAAMYASIYQRFNNRGLPFVVAEFANRTPTGSGCGAYIDTTALVTEANKNQIGWLAWSWGDNNPNTAWNGDCPEFDLGTTWSYDSLVAWGREVCVTLPASIKNTSRRPYALTNGDVCR